MAYSTRAKELRRCRHVGPAGIRCHAFACWGDERRLCAAHGGRRVGKPVRCTCAAYQWPHRPGGGLCRWPDPPEEIWSTPAGTHSPNRKPSPPRIVRRLMTATLGQSVSMGQPWMLKAGKEASR
jgi:hypothetical protein